MPNANPAAKQKFFIPFGDYGRTQGNNETASPNCMLAVHPLGQDYNTIDQGLVLGQTFRPFLKEVTVEEDEKMTSQVMMTFIDKENTISQALSGNYWTFGTGTMVDVGLGYGNNIYFMGRRFRLVGAYPNFPSGDTPTYTVKGYDGRHRMIDGENIPRQRGKGKSKAKGGARKGVVKTPSVFKNKTDSDIISELCWYHGFLLDVDPTLKKVTRVKKKGLTDWEFILSLARKNGYTCWVDFGETLGTAVEGVGYIPGPAKYAKFRQYGIPNWVLHFRKKPHVMEHGFIFDYGKDLLEFNVREEFTSVPTDVEIIHFDRRLRKIDMVAFNPTNSDPNIEISFKESRTLGSEIKFSVGDRMVWTINDKPFKDKKAAIEFAKRFLEERNDDFVVGTGKVIGSENIRPRQFHYLNNIARYSGEWLFTQTRHRFTSDNVYEVEFTARKRMPLVSKTKVKEGTNTITFKQGSLITKQGAADQ